MSYWVVQSFGVTDPERRLSAVRRRLTVDDFVGVVNTEPTDGPRDDVRYEILAMTTPRVHLPDMDSAHDIDPGDETLFGPYMELALVEGEYGAVLGVDDTSCAGSVCVYEREADGVAVVDRFAGDEGEFGMDAAAECADAYGFRPEVWGRSSIRSAAEERNDPFVGYYDVERFEDSLSNARWVPARDPDACPSCDSPDVERTKEKGWHVREWECNDCIAWFTAYDPARFDAATGDCPECDGSLSERDLQYPGMTSTAFECDECGAVAFDALGADDPADWQWGRKTVVGPDVAAYREKHDVASPSG